MKAILTLGIVLSLLIISASAQVPPIELIEAPPTEEQREEQIEICTQNLIAIGKSIQAYLKVNGDFPEWLSDLYHPRYLPDPDILICPADRVGGRAVFPRNIDPKMPVSYGYQFPSKHRERVQENRDMYGDVVPLVRCRHHGNEEFHCLNLNYAFNVKRSFSIWEATPEDLYESREEAIAAIEAGLQRQPDNERLSDHAYPALARLYIETGKQEKVEGLVNLFKSNISPNYPRHYLTLSTMLEMLERNEDILLLFTRLEKQDPNDRGVLRKLAEIHQELGNTELAAEYRKRAEPVSVLVGKPVPDFSATDLDGNPISLQQYRGKVVLLDFWATWSGLCFQKMPDVKRVYDIYKDEGFDIIGITLDNHEPSLRRYLKENDIPWRQVYSGKRWQSPTAQYYGIRTIPTRWLIAKDGTLISLHARGDALEKLVAEALKGKPAN